jgi:hypothetical protein
MTSRTPRSSQESEDSTWDSSEPDGAPSASPKSTSTLPPSSPSDGPEWSTWATSRFWPKVNKTDTCWEWTGTTQKRGYGSILHRGKMQLAHRLSWEMVNGPIPEGLVIDHLCRNPRCVRPDHLEPVTNRENLLRGTGFPAENASKTECVNGHPLSGENLEQYGTHRRCRICNREAMKRWRARRADTGGTTTSSDPATGMDLITTPTERSAGVTSLGLSENQRGELLLTETAHQLTTGGGKPGQGYAAVFQVSDSAMPNAVMAFDSTGGTRMVVSDKPTLRVGSGIGPPSGPAASPARTSPSLASDEAWGQRTTGPEAASPMPSLTLWSTTDLPPSSSRTYRDSSPVMEARTLGRSSVAWQNSGTGGHLRPPRWRRFWSRQPRSGSICRRALRRAFCGERRGGGGSCRKP